MKIKFYGSYSPPATIPVDPGRAIVPTYREVKPDNSYSYLEEIGKTNMDESIQSYSASVDLARKIAMFQSGDVLALESAHGVYADLTDAPKNLMEAMKIHMSIQENFDSLPDFVREAFGSVDGFRSSVFDRTYESKIAEAYKKQFPSPAPEVKDNGAE